VHARELVELTRRRRRPTSAPPPTATATATWSWAADFFVNPSDSLAVLAANAHLAPGYRRHRRRRALHAHQPRRRPGGRGPGIDCYETPTGWKFFGNLLDAGASRSAARRASAPAPTTCARRTACGRCCSGSTSSPCGASPARAILREHWREFGRDYFTRHDYEGIDGDALSPLLAAAQAIARIEEFSGRAAPDVIT
jgi:phosphoglucomutase